MERRLDDWKRRLIDLTRRNRLLHYKPNKSTSLFISVPDSNALFDRLVLQGKPCSVWLPPESEGSRGRASSISGIAETTTLFSELEGGGTHPLGESSQNALPVSARKVRTPKADEIVGLRLQRKSGENKELSLLKWEEIFEPVQPSRQEIERSLIQLQRRARSDYRERGVRVLYLAVGALIWNERGDDRPIVSPLLMCPVSLESSQKEPFSLVLVEEEEISVNPALVVKLQNDFRIELPSVPEEWEGDTLKRYLEEVQSLVAERNWNVRSTVLLDLFSFHKLVMYQDLTKNADHIKGHPLVKTLVGEQRESSTGGDMGGSRLPEEREIDRIQKFDQTFQVLDADSSQQACIQAILQGHSVVLQGPPGTGKSQTIANVIAETVARGRTVLFVAEKMAALEVVYKRLREAGLGDLCLQAHSRMASKKDVILSLKSALDNDLRAREVANPSDFQRLTDLRSLLNSYVLALHELRAPYGRSVFDILSQLAPMHTVAGYSLGKTDLSVMTPGDFLNWEQSFKQMRELWQIAQEGEHHPWFGCRVPSYTFEVQEQWRTRLRELLDSLSQLKRHRQDFSDKFGVMVSDDLKTLEALVSLGFHLQMAPGVEEAWLESETLRSLQAEVSQLKGQATGYHITRQNAQKNYVLGSWVRQEGRSETAHSTWGTLLRLLQINDSSGEVLLRERSDLIHMMECGKRVANTAQALEERLKPVFGVDWEETTPGHSEQLARLALLCDSLAKPEMRWFDDFVHQEAQSLAEALSEQCQTLLAREQALSARQSPTFWDVNWRQIVPELERWVADCGKNGADDWSWENLSVILTALQEHVRTEAGTLAQITQQIFEWKEETSRINEWFNLPANRWTPGRARQLVELARALRELPVVIPASWCQKEVLGTIRIFLRSATEVIQHGRAHREKILSRFQPEIIEQSVEQTLSVLKEFQNQPQQTSLPVLLHAVDFWMRYEKTPSQLLQAFQKFLSDWGRHLTSVTEALALEQTGWTPVETRRLEEIVSLCLSDTLPQRSWLEVEVRERLAAAAQVAEPLCKQLLERRENLLQRYDIGLFEMDLDGLIERFSRLSHKPPINWFSPSFRADRTQMLRVLRSAQLPPQILEDLVEAREVVRIQNQANEILGGIRSDLGRYYAGEKTNFQAVSQGLHIARKAKSLLEGNFQSEKLLQVLTGEVTTPELLRSVLGRYQQACQHLDSLISSLHSEIPIYDLMDVLRLQDLGKALEQLQEPVKNFLGDLLQGWDTDAERLEKTAHFVEGVFESVEQLGRKQLSPSIVEVLTGVNNSGQITLEEVLEQSSRGEAIWTATRNEWAKIVPLEDLKEGAACQHLRQSLESHRPRMDALFGRFSNGVETNFQSIEAGLQHVQRVVDLWRSGPQWQLVHPNSRKSTSGNTCPPQLINLVCADNEGTNFTCTKSPSFGANFWDDANLYLKEIGEWQALLTRWLSYMPFSRWDNGLEWHQFSWIGIRNWVTKTRESLQSLDGVVEELTVHSRADYSPRDIQNLLLDWRRVESLADTEIAFEVAAKDLRERLGCRYSGLNTDWDDLEAALKWTDELLCFEDEEAIELTPGIRALALQGKEILNFVPKMQEALKSVNLLIAEIRAEFDDPKGLPSSSVEDWWNKGTECSARLHDLQMWADYQEQVQYLESTALGELVTSLRANPPSVDALLDAFRKAVWQRWVDGIFEQDKRLRSFRGQNHLDLVAQFRELDHRQIGLASGRIAEAYSARKPRSVDFGGSQSEVALLRKEAGKKSRHLPLGKLFLHMPNLLARLKPCLMMSPLTVSQYLSANALTFDLVIFDEASQIFTEDAVGAIYRGKQLLVAGDSKQLPPTDFFSGLDTEGDEEEEGDMASDFQSLLDECGARFPEKMLRWHYRSRHESLIAFSNHRYYSDRLFTFPSATHNENGLGVQFHHVPDGRYDRGRSKKNVREAQVVAEQVLEHFAQYPQKSLGVVAFSKPQAEAIEDALALKRKQRREFEEFFSTEDDRLDGFFVKSLENVQGDERDCIIFSLGYGYDSHGTLTMNFGPLNKAGGERRLNVAITRARDKVLLVSSIRAADLDLSKTAASGVLNLYHYLDYAERGTDALTLSNLRGGEMESPFEEEVAASIRELGFNVVPQVGCSGYRIDLGVVHPQEPGRFLLGVECDGATYHSAATARDRDRLRQQVLESLGWRIHRIWSPDWVRFRDREVARLRETLEAAIRNRDVNGFGKVVSRANQKTLYAKESPSLDKVPIGDSLDLLPGTLAYHPYSDQKTPGYQYGTFFDDPYLKQEGRLQEVVKREGPLHKELALRRIATDYRLSSQLTEVFEECLRRCVRNRTVVEKDGFLWWPGNQPVLVRVPLPNRPETRRDVVLVPVEELREALKVVLRHTIGTTLDDLIRDTARLMGWNRMGTKIRNQLEKEVQILINTGEIQMKNDQVTLAAP